jgi:hypothetical protein
VVQSDLTGSGRALRARAREIDSGVAEGERQKTLVGLQRDHW